jgi:hypothetical protein
VAHDPVLARRPVRLPVAHDEHEARVAVLVLVLGGEVFDDFSERLFIRNQKINFVNRNTVRWSNFDRLDPKMGVFLQSTEATPCGHLLR